DAADGLDDGFAMDAASGLYVPAARPLITGPAALAVARRLNPFVLESMDADEADAFFRRIRRAMSRVGRGVLRTAGGLARRAVRVAGRVARAAAPILSRALPIVQRVAGM